VRFQKTFYRYVTTPDANATVLLGADSAPTTVYGTPGMPPSPPGKAAAANVDNVLSAVPSGTRSPTPVSRVAVVMRGPTGAANQNANLYVWDSGNTCWYLVNAAPIALVNNQVLFFDALAPCEQPQNNQQTSGQLTAPSPSQGGVDYMLVVAAAAPTAGQYQFSMTPILNTQ
jgi:hypothetical protein